MTLHNSYSDVTNSVGDTPFIFHTINIPADTLVANGDKVCAEYFFTNIGSGGVLEIYVLSNYITVVPVIIDLPKDIKIRVVRTSTTSIRILVTTSDTAMSSDVVAVQDIDSLDLENDPIDIVIQGMDGSLDPDVITCKYAFAEYKAV